MQELLVTYQILKTVFDLISKNLYINFVKNISLHVLLSALENNVRTNIWSNTVTLLSFA